VRGGLWLPLRLERDRRRLQDGRAVDRRRPGRAPPRAWQADRGVSLDAQRAKVAAYAELYDLELVEVVVDAGASAKTLDRPGLARALGMLRKGGEADALLVVSRSPPSLRT
jgi:hypothetical protein